MSINYPFSPAYGSGVSIATTGTASSVAVGFGNKSLCITNLDSVPVYFRVGYSSVVATVFDYVVAPGMQVVISKQDDHTHVSAITSGSAGLVNVIAGEGN
jgi:hypothetical protein